MRVGITPERTGARTTKTGDQTEATTTPGNEKSSLQTQRHNQPSVYQSQSPREYHRPRSRKMGIVTQPEIHSGTDQRPGQSNMCYNEESARPRVSRPTRSPLSCGRIIQVQPHHISKGIEKRRKAQTKQDGNNTKKSKADKRTQNEQMKQKTKKLQFLNHPETVYIFGIHW